jgi:hypothetical protein
VTRTIALPWGRKISFLYSLVFMACAGPHLCLAFTIVSLIARDQL